LYCPTRETLSSGSALIRRFRPASKNWPQKSTEGQLTEEERAEYSGFVRANKFVAILKRQALHLG
jgi:hypothetical protein